MDNLVDHNLPKDKEDSFSIFNINNLFEIKDKVKSCIVNQYDNYGLSLNEEQINKIIFEEDRKINDININFNCICSNYFIECEYCYGKFDFENAFKHMEKCLFKDYLLNLGDKGREYENNKDSLSKCEMCKNYVFGKDSIEHSDICKNSQQKLFNDYHDSSNQKINIGD
jgi:hypothetical protein